jgi:phage terminase small subunit
MKNSKPKCPPGLSSEARIAWRKLQNDYEIVDNAGLILLEQAMRCLDQVRVAEALVKRHGQVAKDRFGQVRQSPLMLNLRDSRNLLAKFMRALNFDVGDGKGEL